MNLSRSKLAAMVGIDPARLVNYETGRAAMPYHVGSKILGALDVCQRWAVTGAEPRKGYVEVTTAVEDLIPRTMPFTEAFDRILATEILDRIRAAASAYVCSIRDVTPEMMMDAGPVGEHKAARYRRLAHSSAQAALARLIEFAPTDVVKEFDQEFTSLAERYEKKLLRGSTDDRQASESREISEQFRKRMMDWIPPRHAGNTKPRKSHKP